MSDSYRLGPSPYTSDWYALRTYDPKKSPPVAFGASEAAACCGLSRYETPFELYLRKRGEISPKEETDAMRLGKMLEPIVIGEFGRRTGWEVDAHVPMLISKRHPCIGATPDAWVTVGKECRTMDAKTTSFRRAEEFGEEWTDELPDDILLQVQQQLFVSGCEIGHVAVLLDGRTLQCYTVEANEQLQEVIVEAELEMLDRITRGDPPEPTYNHKSTNELLKALYGVDPNTEVILSDDAAAAWYGRETLKEQIKDLESQVEELTNILLHRIGNAASAIMPDGSKLAHKLISVKASTREVKAYTYHKLTKPKVKE